MADLNQYFKVTDGLDAGGDKVVNVAMADKAVGTDAVNVDFFNYHNGIQQYSQDRGYDRFMAIIYNNRPYYAKEDIQSPAGKFSPSKWQPLRTDPKWDRVTVTSADTPLKSGDYIAADTSVANLNFSMPVSPEDGDTVTVKDIGGQCGINDLAFVKTAHDFLHNGITVRSLRCTTPYAMIYFIFARNLWHVYMTGTEPQIKFASPGDGDFQCQNGDRVFRRSSLGEIHLILPKHANNGDVVETYDLDGLTSSNHATLRVHPESKDFVGSVGTKELTGKRSGHGSFVYDAQEKLWRIWDGDQHTRLQVVRNDTELKPNTYVAVVGDQTGNPDVTLTLPTSIEIGDRIQVSLTYMYGAQTCKIKVNDPQVKILMQKDMVQFPKRTSYPPVSWEGVRELSFRADLDYVPYLEFSYIETEDGSPVWMLCHAHPMVERVDPARKGRVGVIALATQDETNKNHEDNPSDEVAVTPKVLANKTATEERRGIARIATQEEVHQHTGANFLDDVIVTPKKLNACVASEEHRGVLEIATQEETNTGEDDTRAITPHKLDNRRASEDLAGIAALTPSGGRSAEVRDQPGTGIYANNDHHTIVTPKTFSEGRATETNVGVGYLATVGEVQGATLATPQKELLVTASTLAKRTATEDRTGILEIATQEETNRGTDDERAITPKKLHTRVASETLHGLAEIATQEEFNRGEDDARISTPLKIKTFLSQPARIQGNRDQGVNLTGNIWGGVNVSSLDAATDQKGVIKIATPQLVDAGADNTTAVTPATLHGKKATESKEGIIKVGTQAETVAGAIDNVAVSPKNLKHVVQVEETWQAEEQRRGFVKIATAPNSFIGNNTDGSTQPIEQYQHNGMAVSPKGLNTALQNFLPKMATAQNSLKLGGVLASNWVRRDIDQNIKGDIILDKSLTVGGEATFSNGVTMESLFVTGHETTAPTVGHVVFGTREALGYSSITMYGRNNEGENPWVVLVGGQGSEDVAGHESLTFAPMQPDGEVNGKGFEILRNGDTFTPQDARIARNIFVGAGVFVGSETRHAAITHSANDNTLNIGYGQHVNLIAGSGSLTTQIGERKYQIIHQANADDLLAASFVQTSGGTMTGKLIMNDKPILSYRRETAADVAPDVNNAGWWNMRVTSQGIYNTYPEKKTGSLMQWGTDENGLTQIWTPDGGHKHYIRTGSNGVWGAWGEIYTKQNRPTAQEIGAMVADGGLTNSMTVRDWVKIGNVKIIANPQTRTVEFVWED